MIMTLYIVHVIVRRRQPPQPRAGRRRYMYPAWHPNRPGRAPTTLVPPMQPGPGESGVRDSLQESHDANSNQGSHAHIDIISYYS